MQQAGEQLLSQVAQALFAVYPDMDVPQMQSQLSEIISRFDIRRIEDDQAHPDVAEKIDLFLSGKKLEGLSKISLGDYERQLRIFAKQMPKKTSDITTADIRVYLGRYQHQKIATVSTKLSILKSFFGWLSSEDIIPKDPTSRIKPPKKEKRLPKALSVEEFEMLREACQDNRQRALVEALYATGCRLGEVYRINRHDINYNTQSCRVIGKGNKEREVYFSFKAMYHLKKYLLSRKDETSALFVSSKQPHGRLSMRGIQAEIRKIAKQAGLQKKVSPHTLRHTFATLTLNNGADLVAVQELLGHANPATTQIYATISAERKREQHKKHLVQ